MKARIGIEIHVELASERKLFCDCPADRDGAEGSRVCPYCARRAGRATLNEQAVNLALTAALALRCDIAPLSRFVRKANASPYLPGGYQVTQMREPIAENGLYEGIRIARLQLEEDAARPARDGMDWSRAGVPLLEVVTEPDFACGGDARAWAESLRLLLRFLRVTTGRMERGAIRADANVSVGNGRHTEIKGIGSFRNLQKAVDAEIQRQLAVLERGEQVGAAILHWHEREKALFPAQDDYSYRWEEETEMPRLYVSRQRVAGIGAAMGEMPERWLYRMTEEWKIERRDAEGILRHRAAAEFYAKAVQSGADARLAAKWILGPMYTFFATEERREAWRSPVDASYLAVLARAMEQGLEAAAAVEALMQALKTGREILPEIRRADEKEAERAAHRAIQALPEAVEAYRNGKERAVSALMGYAMQSTDAGAREVREKLEELLLTKS